MAVNDDSLVFSNFSCQIPFYFRPLQCRHDKEYFDSYCHSAVPSFVLTNSVNRHVGTCRQPFLPARMSLNDLLFTMLCIYVRCLLLAVCRIFDHIAVSVASM